MRHNLTKTQKKPLAPLVMTRYHLVKGETAESLFIFSFLPISDQQGRPFMKTFMLILLSVLTFAIPTVAQQKDDKNCQDHPLFTRMPDYWIRSCTQKQFDAFSFDIGPGKKGEVQGEFWQINYYPQATLKSKPSELQIQLNYENAIKKLGGTILFKDKSKLTMKLAKDGKEVWVAIVTSFTGSYTLYIVQKKAMEQDIVANADVFSNDLKTTGHSAVYGIYFDTGKSDIKPESEQAIAEISKLLKAEAGLKVYVVGHTDNVGSVESNMKLSQERADAVVKMLVSKGGIAADRLRAYGDGPFAPVTTNDTEEGKAKNRRVELVKQ
jgi:OmpA-OmpF porin, OOP family